MAPIVPDTVVDLDTQVSRPYSPSDEPVHLGQDWRLPSRWPRDRHHIRHRGLTGIFAVQGHCSGTRKTRRRSRGRTRQIRVGTLEWGRAAAWVSLIAAGIRTGVGAGIELELEGHIAGRSSRMVAAAVADTGRSSLGRSLNLNQSFGLQVRAESIHSCAEHSHNTRHTPAAALYPPPHLPPLIPHSRPR